VLDPSLQRSYWVPPRLLRKLSKIKLASKNCLIFMWKVFWMWKCFARASVFVSCLCMGSKKYSPTNTMNLSALTSHDPIPLYYSPKVQNIKRPCNPVFSQISFLIIICLILLEAYISLNKNMQNKIDAFML